MNKMRSRSLCNLNLIVAVDRNWGIGREGQLLFHVREDMKRFKELTMGNVLVYGRKTLQSFPRGEPLPGRTNIVLTRQESFAAGSALIVHSLSELAGTLGRQPDEGVFVLGGTSVYQQLLPYCGQAFVTRVSAIVPADSFFPDLDQVEGWTLVRTDDPFRTQVAIGGYEKRLELTVQFCLYRQEQPRCLTEFL
jgi:dihydrofolate reductase